MCLKAEVYLSFFTSSLGRPDHASPAADPRTDRYVAPRAATEHPHPQRADSEDCRRSTLTVKLRGGKTSTPMFPCVHYVTAVSFHAGNSLSNAVSCDT